MINLMYIDTVKFLFGNKDWVDPKIRGKGEENKLAVVCSGLAQISRKVVNRLFLVAKKKHES